MGEKSTVKIKIVTVGAIVPKYANPGDAGMDLFASARTVVNKGCIVAVPTGIAMEIPEKHVGLIWDKSGLALKNGVKTMGGVIDSSYRGEVKVIINNCGDDDLIFEKDNKVAQIIIHELPTVVTEVVEELSDTVRGTGGFGSTGKK